ncbi:MAG TPA: UbiA family prenyltransferase, partial [Chloroflexota bacterium]|nr:UbiA family prenyltransferase [Chloroflexota bacterium]
MNADISISRRAAIRPSAVLMGLLVSARPKQWTKNVILFGPLVFAYKLFSPQLLAQALIGFAAFCLVSSATYVLNDVLDVESDRLHPTKSLRPLAAARISLPQAIAWAALLAAAGMGLGFAVNVQ